MTIVVIDFMLVNSSNKRRMILLDCPTQHIKIQSRALSGNMGCHIDIFQYDSLCISFVYYIKLREIRNITQTPMSRHWILDIYRIMDATCPPSWGHKPPRWFLGYLTGQTTHLGIRRNRFQFFLPHSGQ